jgi:predicted DNA-binding antitoxin AbrB/MazE fold protein
MERVDIEEGTRLKIKIEEDIKKLRGKYKSLKPDVLTLRDEIYDRRTHLRR